MAHLLWLLRQTRQTDWLPGRKAIVYKSVAESAHECAVTPRTINERERALEAAFGIGRPRSFNRRRFGWRDAKTGAILQAYGVDLTPLADLLPELRAIKAELDRQREQRKGRRAQLSGMRGHIRQLVDAVLRTGDRARIETALALFESIRGRIGEKTGLADIDARITRAGEVQARLEAMLLEAVPAVEAAPEVPENGPGGLWKTCGKAGGKTREISDGSDKNLRPIESRIDLKTKDKSLSARATFRSDGRLPVRDLSGSTGVAREREARAARVRQALAELAAAPLPERLRKVAREGTGLRPITRKECLPREAEAPCPAELRGNQVDQPERCPENTMPPDIAAEVMRQTGNRARTTTAAGEKTQKPECPHCRPPERPGRECTPCAPR